MITLSSKSDIHQLLESDNFLKLLQLDNAPLMLPLESWPLGYVGQYYPDADSDEGPEGVFLFTTAQVVSESDVQSYLQVVKLYGQPELPFRVLGVEIWDEHDGIAISKLSDLRTLSEALDYAFTGHELQTFDHADIQAAVAGKDTHAKAQSNTALGNYEAKANAETISRKAQEARMAAPIHQSDIAEVMSIAKANGLALHSMDNFDYAKQMNLALFGGKAEVFVLYTADIDLDGSRNEVAILATQDNAARHTYFDIDGTPKTAGQAMESYKIHLENLMFATSPRLKEDGLGIEDFTEIVIRKSSRGELISEAAHELSCIGEQYSEAQRIIGNAVQAFRLNREAEYQAKVAESLNQSLEM